ncbi:MAG TPA: peptidylprolyl isomerase [Candidatus Dormibacteraeota bacterium]|nr:peptidylprolyl isomerase [Candidatus Dormibacteraeota bacterium]
MSQSPQRSPVLLGIIVLVFAGLLGAGAYGLNLAVNPAPKASPSAVALRPSPTSTLPLVTAQNLPCPAAPASHTAVAGAPHSFSAAPAMGLDKTRGYCAYMSTAKGLITIRLFADTAPLTVNSFVFLAKQGFYDGLTFHRVCPNAADSSCGGALAIAQGGDPKGDGTGGPGYQFADEAVRGTYTPGTIAMANSGPNTNGSQFFINTGDNSSLPRSYNLFGTITAGLDVAKALAKGDRIVWVDIETTDLAGPSPAAPASPAPAASAAPAPSPSPS